MNYLPVSMKFNLLATAFETEPSAYIVTVGAHAIAPYLIPVERTLQIAQFGLCC